MYEIRGTYRLGKPFDLEKYSVLEVISGDTFKVSPDWSFNNKSGNLVCFVGYEPPDKEGEYWEMEKHKLIGLVLHQKVMLDPIEIDEENRLLANVYDQHGYNIAYFMSIF